MKLIRAAMDILRYQGPMAFRRAFWRHFRRSIPPTPSKNYVINPMEYCDHKLSFGNQESIDIQYTGHYHDRLPKNFSKMEMSLLGPKPFIYRYDNCRIVGYHPIIDIEDKYFMPRDVGNKIFWNSSKSNINGHLKLSYLLKKKFDFYDFNKVDNAYLLLGRRGTHYPDWLLEILPKIIWYEELCDILNKYPVIITHSPLKNWQMKTLELMGIDTNLVIQHSEVTVVDNLYIPPHPIRTRKIFHPSPASLEKVRSRLSKNIQHSSNQDMKRLFVSRSDAKTRRVVNRGDLLKLLDEYNFVSINPGLYSIEEQINLFQGSDFVIGPTGAGLSNILYSTEGSMVELIPNGCYPKYPHWFILANERSLDYEFLLCESVSTKYNRPIQSDIRVDIKSLRKIIQHKLN